MEKVLRGVSNLVEAWVTLNLKTIFLSSGANFG